VSGSRRAPILDGSEGPLVRSAAVSSEHDQGQGARGGVAAKTMQGIGPATPISPPAHVQGETDAGSPRASWSRESAPTDLGFVPPPDAPKVELSPALEHEAALAASFPPPAQQKKARAPAAPTDVMPEVQARRAKLQRDKSDLPLKIGLVTLAVVIAALVTALAYGLLASPG
jgi:hypothetical protein